MSDTMTLRDHSKQCVHGFRDGHWNDWPPNVRVPNPKSGGHVWCPGGKEIVLIPDTIGGAKVGTYPDGEPMRLRKWRRWVTEWEADDG